MGHDFRSVREHLPNRISRDIVGVYTAEMIVSLMPGLPL